MNVSLSVTPAITSGHIALISDAVSASSQAVIISTSASNVAIIANNTALSAAVSASNAYQTAVLANGVAVSADNKAVSAISVSQAATLTANTALSIANTAITSAGNIRTLANNAQSTADSAQGTAATALTNAGTAITSAGNAVALAGTALTSASNIISSLSAKADLVGGLVPLSQLPALGSVTSVNGLTGAVVLTKSSVGLSAVQNIDTTIASNIVQTSAYRFVTDAEKAIWNAGGGGTIPSNVPRTQTFSWSGSLSSLQKTSAAQLSSTFANTVQILAFNTTHEVVFTIEERLVSNDSLVKTHYLSSIISGAVTDAAPFTLYTVTSPNSACVLRLYAENTTTSAASVTATGITLNINA